MIIRRIKTKISKRTFIIFLIAMAMMLFIRDDVLAATATVDTSQTYQTIEGFGVSLAWWVTNLYNHSEKGEMYNYIFNELGLDILRLRNIYHKGEDDGFPIYGEIVDSFYSLSENEPKILITSWSPPAALKSNNYVVGGTLDTTASGEYVYGDFAQYWVDALDSFADVGIVPDYISVQNEPSWYLSNESCRMEPTENDTSAGYDQALDSVYHRLQAMGSPPKILAPEVLGINYNLFQYYADQFNHDYAYGYAYHLYHGGDGNVNPDAFNNNLIAIANNYSDKPIFQTEYDYGDWFNTAWLMHNCLVYGNVSGYFYWSAVWGEDGAPFIVLIGGSHYSVEKVYWAFRQYSKAIHYGWQRVGADIDEDSLLISAYIGPEKDELSVVVINISHSNDSVDLDFQGFDMSGANMLRTSNTETCALFGYYDGSTVNLPARSITTVSTLEISSGGAEVEDEDDNDLNAVNCSLAQNYPNPFNARTTIEYSIAEAGLVKLAVYDISGRKMETLVEEVMPAGKHTVNVELTDLSPGIYFYRLETGGKRIQKKMVLIK